MGRPAGTWTGRGAHSFPRHGPTVWPDESIDAHSAAVSSIQLSCPRDEKDVIRPLLTRNTCARERRRRVKDRARPDHPMPLDAARTMCLWPFGSAHVRGRAMEIGLVARSTPLQRTRKTRQSSWAMTGKVGGGGKCTYRRGTCAWGWM